MALKIEDLMPDARTSSYPSYRIRCFSPDFPVFNSDIAAASLQNVPASYICYSYWYIQSLTVSYTYVLNSYEVNREIIATTTKLPKDRWDSSAIIYYNDTDPVTATDYHIFYDLTKVYYDQVNQGIYGMRLEIEEADAYGSLAIGFTPVPGKGHISATTEFLKSPVTLYLSYDTELVTSASFSDLSITMTPWEESEE